MGNHSSTKHKHTVPVRLEFEPKATEDQINDLNRVKIYLEATECLDNFKDFTTKCAILPHKEDLLWMDCCAGLIARNVRTGF